MFAASAWNGLSSLEPATAQPTKPNLSLVLQGKHQICLQVRRLMSLPTEPRAVTCGCRNLEEVTRCPCPNGAIRHSCLKRPGHVLTI
jgi:hypothetical protein